MNKLNVAILGNFNENYGPHYTMDKCFKDLQENFDFNFEWIATENLVDDAQSILNKFQGIVAGSGPYKSKEGVINGIRCARKNNIPFFGTCSGFSYGVLEFAQSLFNLPVVYHPYEVTDLREEETFLEPLTMCCAEMHTIGFKPVNGTLTSRIYDNTAIVYEESHCTYGVRKKMIDRFGKEGLIVSGSDEEGEGKIMEYNKNDFFLLTLFLPQFRSSLQNPHPLFSAFFKAAERKSKSILVATG